MGSAASAIKKNRRFFWFFESSEIIKNLEFFMKKSIFFNYVPRVQVVESMLKRVFSMLMTVFRSFRRILVQLHILMDRFRTCKYDKKLRYSGCFFFYWSELRNSQRKKSVIPPCYKYAKSLANIDAQLSEKEFLKNIFASARYGLRRVGN